jgi:type I restriction enzyme R subunit
MTTDTSEKGLEAILVEGLCERGWTQGKAVDFVPKFGLDLEQLRTFLRNTQPAIEIELDLSNDTATRNKSLDRIAKEITGRGIIDVLRTRRPKRTTKRTALQRCVSCTTARPTRCCLSTCVS